MDVAPPDEPSPSEGPANKAFKLDCSLESVEKFDESDIKIDRLIRVLEKDLKAADFKWSLFVGAAQNFRYDSCLSPFPPMFMDKNGYKDIDELSNYISDTPPLDLLPQRLRDSTNINPKLVDLLFYVLVTLGDPYLQSIPSESHDEVLKKVPNSSNYPRPQYIFQVVNKPLSRSESKWKEIAKDKETLFAYHGSKLENFYSILNYGLQQHLNKNKIYGSGTYLSSELSISLLYGRGSCGWGASVLGAYLSCIAMCELVNNSDHVNCQRSTLMEARGDNRFEGIEAKRQAEDSIGGEVPHKYYVVTNDDLLRVRYLLVYANQPTLHSLHLKSPNNIVDIVRRWLRSHPTLAILILYSAMLASISLINNPSMKNYYRMIIKKIYVFWNGKNM